MHIYAYIQPPTCARATWAVRSTSTGSSGLRSRWRQVYTNFSVGLFSSIDLRGRARCVAPGAPANVASAALPGALWPLAWGKIWAGFDVWPCGIVCCSLCGLTHPPSIYIPFPRGSSPQQLHPQEPPEGTLVFTRYCHYQSGAVYIAITGGTGGSIRLCNSVGDDEGRGVPKQRVGAQRMVLIRAQNLRNKAISCIGQRIPPPPPPTAADTAHSAHSTQPDQYSTVAWPLQDIVITNIVWCVEYEWEVGRGVLCCVIIMQEYCTRVGHAGGRGEWKDGWFVHNRLIRAQ